MSGSSLVLVLEDEALIAMALEDYLEDAGYAVAGSFATCDSALRWLEHATPDVAILDTTLRDGTCAKVAAELNRRGIPFIVHSGNRESRNEICELAGAIWVEKPSSARVIAAALHAVLRSSALTPV